MNLLRLTPLFSLALLSAGISLKALEPAFIRQFEYRVFDLYQQLRPRPYEDTAVRIVDLDDESLRRLGQWPWPRSQMAKLTDTLNKAGAAAIAFDIVFAEPDRTAPAQVLPLWGEQPALSALLTRLPDPDAAFAASIKHSNAITGFVLTDQPTAATAAIKGGYVFAGNDDISPLPAFVGAVTSLPALESAAAGNGALNSEPDIDGILRRIPLFFRIKDKPYPSLVAESLRVAQGAPSFILKTAEASGEGGGGQGITSIRTGHITIPTDAHGGLWVYYTQHVPERYIPAWRVLDGSFNAEDINGSIILIGTSAAGLKDIRATPLNPASAGVEVHAQAIEQALLGVTLSRPDWMKGAEICLMVLAGGLMLLLSGILRPLWSALLMGTLLAAAAGVSWHAFTAYGLLVEPVSPMAVVVMLYFAGSLSSYMHSERERRHIRHAFSRYMAPELVEQLAAHPERLKLGGENRELTVMFCDIRGFTTLSERLRPEELTQLLNRFLTPMTQAVLTQHGTIDKYIGDCIMAFWNAPLDDANHAAHAARAALAMQAVVARLNETEAEKLHVGIGLNTGLCCVGNMGSDQRFNYSALGDEVNLASRLEGGCKLYGVDIILGPATVAALGNFALLELDLLRVKGRQQAVRIHTLLGDETLAAHAPFRTLAAAHDAMLRAYRNRHWQEVLEKLDACRTLAKNIFSYDLQELYALYETRCREFIRTPPPPEWEGVHEAQSK